MKNFFSKRNLYHLFFINLGVLGLAFAFSFFLAPYNIVAGGIGGVAQNVINIIKNYTNIKLTDNQVQLITSGIILGVNVILLILSYILVGKDFTIKTMFCSIVYPIYVWFFGWIFIKLDIKNIMNVQEDVGNYLILILFGAIISGSSIGLAIKHGASSGGVDIIQQIMFKVFHVPYSVTLNFVDGCTIVLAGIIAKNLTPIFYGIIYVYIAGRMIDSVVFAGFQSYSVNIITSCGDAVKALIMKEINRGSTIVRCKGGYTGQEKKMVVCIMSSHEVSKIRGLLPDVDKEAFMFVNRASEVSGRGFTREKRD